jgi:UDP-3-O-[3-hydroxymyristoyl] glucosamine N-acyltransferase
MLVREIATYLGSTFEGDGERPIDAVASLEAAGSMHAAFVSTRRAEREALASAAGCLLVTADFPSDGLRTLVRCRDPRAAGARLIARLQPPPAPPAGIHPSAVIGVDCQIGEGVSIGPNCTVGDRVTLGAGTVLRPNVSVYHDVTIGARCLLHSGAVIGADGFGFVFTAGHYEKFPQVGSVTLGDDVEIGANSTVDRAALGITVVGDGTKLDNMVHIAHNCRLGRHIVIAAQTGIAGGCVIEDYCVIGGQVGMGDNVTIKARSVIGSGAGILTSKIVATNGEPYWGTPARPLKEYLESLANLARLPKLRARVRELEERLKRLECGSSSEG